MYEHDHPPAFGSRHPWLDPLAPQDILNPRPDQDLAIAGPYAPRPQDFHFTDIGRNEYYEAVRSVSQQERTIEHMQMDQMRLAHQQATAEAKARDERDVELLLLL
jgi:hypothetical protein